MKKDVKNAEEYFEFWKIGTQGSLILKKAITLSNANFYEKEFDKKEFFKDINSLKVDFQELQKYDSYIILLINSLKSFCKESGKEFVAVGMSDELKKFIELLTPSEPVIEPYVQKRSHVYIYFSSLGIDTINLIKKSYDFIEFIGDIIKKFALLLINPKAMRWKDFPYHFTRSGVSAVFIVLLIVFLIGVITGYQGAVQLSRFGADIYIADLVGISITRELSPLMTAILVAGRSGSAFAAEIGTMKVSEELDALHSLGFDSIRFLILPRVLAVMIAMPILTLMADAAGIFGGLLTAIGTLDITVAGYLNELQRALSYADILSGVGKSIVFGFLISTVGCFSGLQVSGGAESVGKYTTAAVVSGVLLIIFSDAVFTFLFQAIGI